MQTISREKLQRKLGNREIRTVVEVLAEPYYRKFHLPNAINVPLSESFEQDIQRAVPDKSEPVVVYCQDEACQASPEAARRMDAIGYSAVYDYEAGKADWKEAGLPIESQASSART